MNISSFNTKGRLLALMILTTGIAGGMHIFMYQIAGATQLPSKVPACNANAETLGNILSWCSNVNIAQFVLVAFATTISALLGMVFVAFLRGVSLKSMLTQFNNQDNKDSPQTVFIGMALAGFLMTASLAASSPEVMVVTTLLRLSAFFLFGTPAAAFASWVFRGAVGSIEEWSDCFEAAGTNGPAITVLLGYLIGLAYAMTLL
jgi:hypothetical protein